MCGVAALVLAYVLLGSGNAAAQDVETTTTSPPLLVDGTTTSMTVSEPGVLTTAPPAGPGIAGEVTETAPEGGVGSASARLWTAAGVLVVLALAVLVLTVLYWRSTRPTVPQSHKDQPRRIDLDQLLTPAEHSDDP